MAIAASTGPHAALPRRGGNLSRCAESRRVHPSAIVYRPRRIKEITGRDPHVPDDLLLLQFGLKIFGLNAI